jgi:NAD(P)-dependent dehydrogenase (short-subunit alcohol dehydrogenase family)
VDLDHRIALVTGATGALGASVALDLLASGARVAFTYRSEREQAAFENRAAQSGLNVKESVFGEKVDLVRAKEVASFVEEVRGKWGRIDFLLCIAGGFAAGKSYETDEETWDRMLSTNLKSVYLALQPVVPVMIEQNFGRIVTVSSGAIVKGGGAGLAAYAVSKGAVRQLTEILADELVKYEIRVHCVMPGTMDTAANRAAMPKADFSKWVKTEDVARVIHFLLSDPSRAVRSVVIPVLG